MNPYPRNTVEYWAWQSGMLEQKLRMLTENLSKGEHIKRALAHLEDAGLSTHALLNIESEITDDAGFVCDACDGEGCSTCEERAA